MNEPELTRLTSVPSADYIELLKKRISGWLRQARFRARGLNITTDVALADIVKLYEASGYKCAYCGGLAGSPDHPFPLKERGPCVLANILPCCDECRAKKMNHNLVRFHRDGHITKDQWQMCITEMVHRKGGDKLKEYLKTTFPGRD